MVETGRELKGKKKIVFVEDTIQIKGIRYEEKAVGARGGMKKVPYETETEIKVKLTSRICEFFCKGELINRFAYKGKIKNTQITNLAKVLIDIKAFDISKEARQWIVEEKIFERLSSLKDELDEKNKDEYKSKIEKLEEEQDVQKQVLMFLSMGQDKRKDATEKLAKEFLKKEVVYSTRDDKNSEMWIYKEGIFIPQAKTYIKCFCREILQQAFTSHLCNEVIAKIETDTYIEQRDFFKLRNINLIAVENGVLDIITKDLKPNSPDYFFFNKIPVMFDKNKKCDKILEHLNNVLGNEKDILVMQELFGYLLYRDYQIEKAFMLTGYGRNGKGKTIELMKRFLGVENCANIPLQQFDKDIYAMGELFNKMANLAADISSNELKQTGNFKNLTGHDLVSASRKYLAKVHFVNYAKMIFCANELPRTTDLTMAFFNRWVLIDFPFTFISRKEYDALPKDKKEGFKIADTKIIEKLSCPNELSGLLNWSLEGLNRLLTKGDFSSSKTTEEVKKDWIRKSDSLTSFVNEEMIESPEGYVSKSDFRQRYKQYCRDHKLKPFSENKIKRILLEELGVWDTKRNIQTETDDGIAEIERKPCWIGIEFKPK